MEHLVCNVHHWGRGPTNRLLAECLVPAVRELRGAGLARRFWFQRFDARGPHLFVLLGTEPGRADELGRLLSTRLEAWIAAHPSTEPLTGDELRTRHEQCRGKRLCALDADPGFAANNSVRWAPHPPDGYPLDLAAGVAERDALWVLLSRLAEWTPGRLDDAPGAAVRWMAAVDAELRRAHEVAEGYWRFHAGTLLTGLHDRLARDEAAVLEALGRGIGARNCEAFAGPWAVVQGGEAVWDGLGELLRVVLAADGRTMEQRLGLLREINHSVLSQLGQSVAAHVPLVLYAWLREASPALAAR
jgi:hypothetical protein